MTRSWLTVRSSTRIHVGQGDVAGSTVFHVPSADAVVCGDVVYNNVHMMMYEADEAKREAWIASIDAVAALKQLHYCSVQALVGYAVCRSCGGWVKTADVLPGTGRAATWRFRGRWVL